MMDALSKDSISSSKLLENAYLSGYCSLFRERTKSSTEQQFLINEQRQLKTLNLMIETF